MKNNYETPTTIISELLFADIVTTSDDEIKEDDGSNDGEWID